MPASDQNTDLRYDALAETALAAAAGESVETVADKGLTAAVRFIGLTAGALFLWDDAGQMTARVISAAQEADRETLLETEQNLLAMLRHDFKIRSAYMSAGDPDNARALFTLPLEVGGKQIGALAGIKAGAEMLFGYDYFLRALAAVLSLATGKEAPEGVSRAEFDEKVKAERTAALVELAVAINHEINNPLTAVLGNLQLVLLKNKNLPEDVVNKLKTIENSANKIKEVTARLMAVSQAGSIEYTPGMKMIDLFGEGEKKSGEDKSRGEESGS
jgi:signal transduction histidine kinase